MLAMMVVTAGVVLLSLTLAAVGPPPVEGPADDPARALLDRVVADERWTTAPGVLRASGLDEIVPDHRGAPPKGCRAVLQEVGGETVELFAQGERDGSGERYAASRAVNVCRGPLDVTAGTVTVWVWP